MSNLNEPGELPNYFYKLIVLGNNRLAINYATEYLGFMS
jgi:hypothetical protein